MAEDGVFEQYPVAEWAVGTVVIAFPVARIQELGGNRLVRHKRIHRDGARLDDTGSQEKIWELTCDFHTDNNDPGIDNSGLYPQTLNDLIDSFDIHETGTLTTTTRGKRKCRAESYRRVEDAMERDMAAVVFTFVEDNEDDATAQSFQAPTARAIGKLTGEAASAAAASQGVGLNDAFSQINAKAAELESLASAPTDFIADLDAKANILSSKVIAIEKAFANTANTAGGEVALLLTNPGASHAGRMLRKLSDVARRSTIDIVSAGPRIIAKTFPRTVSLFDVATELNQSIDTLLKLNPKIGDPLAILPKTPINIYES